MPPDDPAPTISVEVRQDGTATSRGTVRSHAVFVDRPKTKGGADLGPMGGELLLLGLGGCFMSNLLAAIAARSAPVTEARVTASGALGGSPQRFTSYALEVSARCDDANLLEKLVTIAERGCIVANTLKQGAAIRVSVKATG